MTDKRPAIPASIRRKVLVEAGHRCAIPTCRHLDIDVHHIIPWETCKKHEYENLIALCPNCHRQVHNDKIDRKSLKIYKSNLRFTHDKFSQFEVDTLFELFALPADEKMPYPPFSRRFIRRLLALNYVTAEQMDGYYIKGLCVAPELISITKEGTDFIKSLDIEHDW